MPPLDLLWAPAPLAYLDAGSAAMFAQALLAGVAGFILFIKLQGRRFLTRFGLGSKKEDPEGPEGPEGE